MILRALVPACILAIASTAASAEACRRPAGEARDRAADCKPSERLQPYDPDRVRAGRSPGFVDLGNGTEVRVGGRVRMDYDVRR
jgi:hypothetical protein